MSKTIALDSSVRKYDDNGHLRVERTVITKAAVNEYYGKEIPGCDELGLIPDKIYKLLRCPNEIQKGMDTFSGKQLLLKHTPVDSRNTEQTLTVGSIGSRLTFEDGKLYADLTFWDDDAIGLIESKKMRELSAGYGYTPDMSPGIWNGEKYDGVMRNIKGNHVALVKHGRIGKDAVIGDSQTIPLKGSTMKLSKGARSRIKQKLTAKVGKLAQDGLQPESVDEIIDEVIEHTRSDGEETKFDEIKRIVGDDDKFNEIVELLGGEADAEDEDDDDKARDEDEGEKAKRERKELEETDRNDRDADKDDEKSKKIAKLEKELRELKGDNAEDEEHEDKPAMDAATVARDVESRINAKFVARDEVEPLVGKIALDGFNSADDVYRYALDAASVENEGVTGKGLRNMVKMLAQQVNQKPNHAYDHEVTTSESTSRFRTR